MAANALRNRPPLGVVRLRGWTANTGYQTGGVTPFVDAARIFSLACSTLPPIPSAFARYRPPLHISPAEIEGWIEAFYFLQTMRLLHQYEYSKQGVAMDNHINPKQLNDLDRRILKEAFRQSRKMQSRLGMEYNL
jgi:CBS domain-containing protein